MKKRQPNESDTTGKTKVLNKIGRRPFLTVAAATAASALGQDRYHSGGAPVRYPDPDVLVLDPRFEAYKLGNSPIQRIYHSKEMLWAEGPAWNAVGR